MKTLSRTILIAAVLGIVAAAPASADEGWRDGHRHHRHEHYGYGYGPPAVVYAPPPVVYAPPPVMYAPPPTVVYAPPPQATFVIPLNFR